jgi:DNA-binding NtrC family response regulator
MADEKKTILVIDDEPLIRDVLRNILEYWGHTVLEAAHGDQALTVHRQQTIDLVIADLAMPGVLIHEALAAILAQDPGLKVIIMSGLLTWSRYLKPLRRLGICIFLRKPFLLDELRAAMREAFSQENFSQAQVSPVGQYSS